MSKTFKFGWLGAAALTALIGPATAQDDNGDEDKGPKSIEDFVADFKAEAGLFPMYRDLETGRLYMELSAADFEKEFIYHVYVEDGSPAFGLFRGAFLDNRILTVDKRFDKIEFAAENTNFKFDPDNALSRAETANITRAPLAVTKIEATTGEGADARYLVDATSFLTGEVLTQLTPWSSPNTPPGSRVTLGKLSSDKTAIEKVANYDKNSDVVVEYVYDNPSPLNFGNPSITDARSVAISVRHSFVEVPENDFKPRRDDFRVGYFTDQATDMTSTSYTPYSDVITRWNLVKKDPTAEISDPVEPIVWWIENTTPEEYR
ncbi:MAG: DUF5117 domain-containing protein, partial [Pseudomonadota bacterium]